MNLVDVHCHIYHERQSGELDAILERARQAGVVRIVLSGVNPEGNELVMRLCRKYPESLRASFGVFPIDALGMSPDEEGLPVHKGPIDLDSQFVFIREHLGDVVAIGEIGLDFHWAKKEETYVQQADNFRRIIRFAKDVHKPIVIHSRKAEKECIDILREEVLHMEIHVVNHCFSGKKNLVKEASLLGHYFSIPSNIVKSEQFQMMVAMVDLKQLLTETDSPWLSPIPGQFNEPATVKMTIAKIAEIKGLSEKEVAETIWKNYVRVFGEK